ncbi:hypothetical protein KM043_017542 [Ampulex compressa]|nr:hypothetical protein KM043_017542 [Ampulex compressa]
MDASTVEVYEEDTGDQPVDYSIKYSERNALTQSRLTDNSQTDRSSKKEFVDHEAKVDLFGDYAETDLDQPTDYSLRYAEDDTDDDEKQSPEYFPSSMQEDTIKTYCTEDTPYETPFNFSTATSMSDLRVVDTKDGDILKKAPKKVIEVEQKTAISFKQRTSLRCEDGQKDLENQKNSPMLEHGQVTPEKIVGYYDGGTSDGFSRANSLSSLSSAVTQQKNASDINSKGSVSDNKEKTNIESIVHNSVGLNRVGLRLAMESGSSTEGKNNPRVVDKEGKVVTFGGQDYYAEETPLMFSRCSSLGSLSGFEQHSIHDDRSSIVSDFSRRTSGIVSPSELPDSPTQTVPPSPHNHKTQASEFGNKIQEDGVRSSVQHLLCSKSHISRNSVFEDDIATFKEESTPIEFSTATSLSSLTIDDEPRIFDNSKSETKLQHALSSVEKDIEICEYAKISLVEIEKDQDQVSDGDDDDEDMLAACISRGIANNRYRQSFKISNIHKPVQSESSNILTKYPKTAILNRLESSVSPIATETSLIVSKSNKTPMEIGVVPDTVYVYCTEDTPADISPVGSQSNLSALSMPSVQEDVEKPEVECQRNDLSDESSNLSGEDEKILHECIQSGIPKVRQITPPPQNSIHFAKKPEILPQKFNICGTPSSSPVEIVHINKNPILQKPMLQATRTHESGLSDESPNQSDDEAILTECIQSAMPKVRSNMPLLVRSVLPIIEKTDITNNRSSLPSMSFYPTEYPVRAKATLKKPQPFEDNLSLSEEEDIILAQCIRSGMPKSDLKVLHHITHHFGLDVGHFFLILLFEGFDCSLWFLLINSHQMAPKEKVISCDVLR